MNYQIIDYCPVDIWRHLRHVSGLHYLSVLTHEFLQDMKNVFLQNAMINSKNIIHSHNQITWISDIRLCENLGPITIVCRH
jgi:hypothetical protein